MQTPLVSAVIPSIKRPDIVLRAIRSVIRQSSSNLKIMVVIDGPDDATNRSLETLRRHQSRYRKFGQGYKWEFCSSSA